MYARVDGADEVYAGAEKVFCILRGQDIGEIGITVVVHTKNESTKSTCGSSAFSKQRTMR